MCVPRKRFPGGVFERSRNQLVGPGSSECRMPRRRVRVARSSDGCMGGTALCTKGPVHYCRAHERMGKVNTAVRDLHESGFLGRSQFLEAQPRRLERPHDDLAAFSVTERHYEQCPPRLLTQSANSGKDGTLRRSAGNKSVTQRDAPNALAGSETERDLA